MKKNLYQWLTFDMTVFVVLNGLIIYFFGNALESLRDIRVFDVVLLGLAAYRAANIISNEVVSKPLRAPFIDEVKEGGVLVEKPKKKGFLGAMGLLIYCPSCTGVWLSVLLVYSYALWPTAVFYIALFLALSAVERIIARTLASIKKK